MRRYSAQGLSRGYLAMPNQLLDKMPCFPMTRPQTQITAVWRGSSAKILELERAKMTLMLQISPLRVSKHLFLLASKRAATGELVLCAQQIINAPRLRPKLLGVQHCSNGIALQLQPHCSSGHTSHAALQLHVNSNIKAL